MQRGTDYCAAFFVLIQKGQGTIMELSEYRARIDKIDDELLRLFAERMQTAAGIAAYKKENALPVLDAGREREKLADVVKKAPEGMREEAVSLYRLLFSLSRSYQHELLGSGSALPELLKTAVASTPQMFPVSAAVACQGAEAHIPSRRATACSGIRACSTAQRSTRSSPPSSRACASTAFCRWKTAQQALSMRCMISCRSINSPLSAASVCASTTACWPCPVRSFRASARSSHTEQALGQCSELLRSLPGVTVTRCANTAEAARMVAQSGRKDLAAIASNACAEVYGLQVLQARVQNDGGNYTRFICIAAKPEIYPGADRTSLLLSLANEPGSLYQVLSRIYGHGINLTKLESRPIDGSDDTFRFYFDLEASVYSPELPKLLGELEDVCEHVCYLGSYSEMV